MRQKSSKLRASAVTLSYGSPISPRTTSDRTDMVSPYGGMGDYSRRYEGSKFVPFLDPFFRDLAGPDLIATAGQSGRIAVRTDAPRESLIVDGDMAILLRERIPRVEREIITTYTPS